MTVPAWARWPDPDRPAWTLGVEEEIMLLDAETLALSPAIEEVLDALPQHLRERATSETHASVVEMATGVHATVDGAVTKLARLRSELTTALETLGLRAASAGTHPTAVWQEVEVTPERRHREVEDAMRVLARREPTCALHVHVGVPTPAGAIGALNQLRAHLPLLLALSGNSPFWQGRDTGLASARTPLFQAFPRVGIPRPFASYADWAHAVDLLVRCQALPDHTHLWWDARLNPALGTVEVRVMDAQTKAVDAPGAQRQRDAAGPEGDFGGLLRSLADAFCAHDGATGGG